MDSRAVRVVETSDLYVNWYGGSNRDRAPFRVVFFVCVFFYLFSSGTYFIGLFAAWMSG